MAWGLLEMGICQLVWDKGYNLEEERHNQRAVRCYTFTDKRNEYLADILSHLSTQIGQYTNKTSPDYPFVYRILANGDVLVGVDTRDIVPLNNQAETDYEQELGSPFGEPPTLV